MGKEKANKTFVPFSYILLQQCTLVVINRNSLAVKRGNPTHATNKNDKINYVSIKTSVYYQSAALWPIVISVVSVHLSDNQISPAGTSVEDQCSICSLFC